MSALPSDPPPIDLHDLIDLLDGLDEQQVAAAVADLPPGVVAALLDQTARVNRATPPDPFAQAQELDEGYRDRAHLTYLASRFARAVKDVEQGQTRRIVVSMPPRSGKSLLSSVWLPTWLLRKHPDWKVGLISHSPSLAISWGRAVRGMIEEHSATLGLSLASDAGAASEWKTTANGGIVSRSAPGQSITGLGFKVMLIDDVVKDFAAAHSAVQRQAIWDWWLANSVTRLEPPSLIVVIGTRWHEDDFIGRLLSPEHEGDPDQWEVIDFPAIAETADVLGREPGQPLYSPLLDETEEEALERWADVRQSVGSYTWTALYQQRPSSPRGAVFDVGWWKFWTYDEKKADGQKVLHFTAEQLRHAQLLDSWDMAFKATEDSDYVVGQRWARLGAYRILVAQVRARFTFTQSKDRMKQLADPRDLSMPFSAHVHERLVEDKANGTAIIDVLKDEIPGLIPINPTESKEARARAVSPDVESGSVLLPLPSDPGNEWVTDLLAELRDFPNGAHDDQVDALTQALRRMRHTRPGRVSVPGRVTSLPGTRRGQAALNMPSRKYGTSPGR